MKTFTEKLDQAKRDYNDLIERKTALTAERQDGITQYEDVYERIQPGDEKEVEEGGSASELKSKAGFRKPFPKSMATVTTRRPCLTQQRKPILIWL